MREVEANGLAAAVGRVLDKKLIAGLLIGGGLATAGYAFSANGGRVSTLAEGSSTLISEEEAVVADAIRQDAVDCAKGDKPGTIGNSIGVALQVHTEMASATPNVEKLFDVSGDCFSGLSQIFDLSFAIPSLGSIISAAQNAVLKYAQKKVCTAVREVTGMVTSPINEAIGKVNKIGGWQDLNGMSNDLIRDGMSGIAPDLGDSYHNAAAGAGTYSVGTNPFGAQQVDFGDHTSGNGTEGAMVTPPPSTTPRSGARPAEAAPAPREREPVKDEKSWRDRLGDML